MNKWRLISAEGLLLLDVIYDWTRTTKNLIAIVSTFQIWNAVRIFPSKIQNYCWARVHSDPIKRYKMPQIQFLFFSNITNNEEALKMYWSNLEAIKKKERKKERSEWERKSKQQLLPGKYWHLLFIFLAMLFLSFFQCLRIPSGLCRVLALPDCCEKKRKVDMALWIICELLSRGQSCVYWRAALFRSINNQWEQMQRAALN